jgi:hypothetical protein
MYSCTKFDSATFNFSRWEEVLSDIRVIGVKNWAKVVLDRLAWHDLVEKLQPHRGLYDEIRRRGHLIILIPKFCNMGGAAPPPAPRAGEAEGELFGK